MAPARDPVAFGAMERIAPSHSRAIVAASVLAVACGSVERRDDWHALPDAPASAWSTARPAEPLDAAACWRVGDRVVYEIVVDAHGESERYEFALSIEALPEPRQSAVDPHPIHGWVICDRATWRYQWAPRQVLHHFGEATVRVEVSRPDGRREHSVFSQVTTANLHQAKVDDTLLLGVNEVVASLLRAECVFDRLLDVIRKPSIGSVIRRLGRVEVAVQWPPREERTVFQQDTPLGQVPAVWQAVAIDANGEPALDGRVLFTFKRAPLLLAAGVLSIEAWHPDAPQRRVTARLIEARRGAETEPIDHRRLGRGLRIGMPLEEACALLGGTVDQTVARGRLADGRPVELLEIDVPGVWMFAVVHDTRLLYACAGDESALCYLRHRGFTPDDEGDGERR